MLGATQRLSQHYPGMQFVAPLANSLTREQFASTLREYDSVECKITDGQARLAISAADLVVCTSGTAALEVMLVNRPMVVVFKFSYLSYALARGLKLLKSRFFSLPNILAGEQLVPELEQHQVKADRIAAECIAWLDDPARCEAVHSRFADLHNTLRKDAAQSAADCVHSVLEAGK